MFVVVTPVTATPHKDGEPCSDAPTNIGVTSNGIAKLVVKSDAADVQNVLPNCKRKCPKNSRYPGSSKLPPKQLCSHAQFAMAVLSDETSGVGTVGVLVRFGLALRAFTARSAAVSSVPFLSCSVYALAAVFEFAKVEINVFSKLCSFGVNISNAR